MNRSSLIIGWVVLTAIAIGVSSAAVGNVGERVSPQPASVLQAAGDVVAFASDDEPDDSSEPTAPPTSTVIDPADAATAVPSTTSGSPTTTGPSLPTPSTSTPTSPTTLPPSDSTTTTTTIVDSSTTTTTTTVSPTTTPTEPPTTTIPEDEIKRRTISSVGGWIRIAWTDDWLRFRRAGSEFGFKFELIENDGERVVARFVSLSKKHLSRIVVELVDGEPSVKVTEEMRDG